MSKNNRLSLVQMLELVGKVRPEAWRTEDRSYFHGVDECDIVSPNMAVGNVVDVDSSETFRTTLDGLDLSFVYCKADTRFHTEKKTHLGLSRYGNVTVLYHGAEIGSFFQVANMGTMLSEDPSVPERACPGLVKVKEAYERVKDQVDNLSDPVVEQGYSLATRILGE